MKQKQKYSFNFFLPFKAEKKLSTALGWVSREALFERYESRGVFPNEVYETIKYTLDEEDNGIILILSFSKKVTSKLGRLISIN